MLQMLNQLSSRKTLLYNNSSFHIYLIKSSYQVSVKIPLKSTPIFSQFVIDFIGSLVRVSDLNLIKCK